MKKTTIIVLAALLTAGLATCASAATPKSGAAAGAALIKMLPKAATGVVGIDVRQLMTSEGVTKALQDPKNKEKLDEFVKMSGIDPTKDIYYAGGAIIGAPTGSAQGAALITLKYDKAKLQALIKQKAPGAKEELYKGLTVYSNIDGDNKQTTRAAFLDATHIVIGTEAGVKGVIDASKTKADSLVKSADMAALLKRADQSGMVWGAIAVPQDLLQKAMASNPQFKMLEGVTGLILSFNEKLDGIGIDLKTIGGTKEQNTSLAQTVNGFRALGAMAGDKEPLVGQLLNGVAITSGTDYTEVAINIPRDVLDKLGEMAKSKAGQFMMKPKKDAAPEVKK